MATKIAFEIEINGVKTAIKSEQELAEATRAVNKAFKDADYGSPERKKLGQELGQLKTLQAQNRQEVRDLAREYQITADKGRDSYRAINAELVNARRTYKELSRAERDVIGPALLGRIGKLDAELKALDADMGQYQRNVGNYSSALDGVGGALLDLGGVDLAALASPAGAVAALGTAAIATAVYVKEMTGEVRALRGEIQTFTGASGAELDEFTARVQGLADTFGASTNEINNAANSAAKQLGISFDAALSQLENGFISGLDANGELLDSTREYATFFADAFGPGEAAANALFETIRRGNEQGIFNDKAVDAVKEVTLRLRELPTATKDALNAIGLSSDEIAAQIQDEGIGAAIATVSTRLGELERDSPQVGQAIAGIFGGPGEDAGFDFLVSLQDINEATGVAIDQSNEYQVQQARTLQVNQEFARAQVEVAGAFGGTGASMDDLLTQGQTLLLRFLVPVIEAFRSWFDAFDPLINAGLRLGRALGLVGSEMDAVGAFTSTLSALFSFIIKPLETVVGTVAVLTNRVTTLVEAGKSALRFIGLLGEESVSTGKKTDFAAEQLGRLSTETNKTKKETEDAAKEVKKLGDETKKTGVITEKFAAGSLGFLQKKLSELQKDLTGATGNGERSILSDIIDVEKAIQDIEDGRTAIRNEIARLAEDIKPVSIIESEAQTLGQVQSTGDALVEAQDRLSEKLNASRDQNLKLQKDRIAQELTSEQEKAARIAEISGTIFSTFNGINDALAQSSQSRADAELLAVQERYAGEIEAAEGNEELQEQLRTEQAAAELAIRQEELEQQKKFRIASARAAQAEGIINILTAPTTIPDPFGTIFKGLRIAALSVQTQLQIGNIKREQVAAKGAVVEGWIRGQSHNGPNGGTRLNVNGRPVLAEAGEFIDYDEIGSAMIVNKRSAANHATALNRMRGLSFPGKRALFSQINADRSHGIPFMASGGLLEPNMAGLAAINRSNGAATGSMQISEESIAAIASATGQAVRVGAAEGTAAGAGDANRRRERETNLRTKTG